MTGKTETPSIEEFNQWNDELERQALETQSKNFKVLHVIKNNVYWSLAPGGSIYKLPMAMSITDYERLSNADTDTDGIEQLKHIIETFAGKDQARRLEREPVQVVMNILNDYGSVIARSQGASLGKSDGSSDDSASTTA